MTTSSIVYIHADHLNTPRKATNEAGVLVWEWQSDAYGNGSPNEDVDQDNQLTTIDLRFPGQIYDAESGLYYNYYRYYDPRLGRYVTSAPIGLNGGINTFAYVAGNPVGAVDPTGELAFLLINPITITAAGQLAVDMMALWVLYNASQNAMDKTQKALESYNSSCPNGDDDECERLRALKQYACNEGIPKLYKGKKVLKTFENWKMVKHLSMEEVLDRRAGFEECLRIRQLVTDRCFNGITDGVHERAENQYQNGKNKMDELIDLINSKK